MIFETIFILANLVVTGAVAQQRSRLDWGSCDPSIDQQAADSELTDCAIIEVPLDYTDKESSQTLKLSLVRVNGTKNGSGGSILYNPGGPAGDPTVSMVAQRDLWEPALDGAFSFIGFSPRGLSVVDKPFSCSSSNAASTASDSSNRRRDALPTIDMQSELVNTGWDAANAFADECRESGTEIGPFMSTAFVARDMLEIVEALDEDGMLRYLAASYGTFLGQVFASMFPDKVQRMYLDAVVDTDDYIAGYWAAALTDADASFNKFLEACVEAGPELCPLANITSTGTETTAESLANTISNFLSELEANQTVIPNALGPYTFQFGLVSPPAAAVVKRDILLNLYSATRYLGLAARLADVISTGNLSVFSENPEITEASRTSYVASFLNIACTDAHAQASGPEDMFDDVAAQQNSSIFSDVFLPQFWACSVWPIEPAERFTGPFGAKKTANSILFAGGLFDPVTPLAAARAAVAKFEGSALLVHGGIGHGNVGQPTNCSWDVVRDYFVDGTVPREGKVCEAEQNAFEYAVARALAKANATADVSASGVTDGKANEEKDDATDERIETAAGCLNAAPASSIFVTVGCLLASWMLA